MADPTSFSAFMDSPISGELMPLLTSTKKAAVFYDSLAVTTNSASITLSSPGIYEIGVISGIVTPGGQHIITVRDDAGSVGNLFIIPCGAGSSMVRKFKVQIKKDGSALNIKIRNDNGIGTVVIFVQKVGD